MSQPDITPENMPSVSIDFMNQTHREEVEIVNVLQDSINTRLTGQDNDKAISQQLNNWLLHTQSHFARENELMQETGFPAYPVHSEEHEIALNGMKKVMDDWHQSKDIEPLKEYVFIQWPNWFLSHVNSMDMVTAQFAVMQGYSGE